MKLWLLRPKDGLPPFRDGNPWYPWYDKSHGFVVRAINERVARAIAAKAAGDEEPSAWLKETFSTCVELTLDGPEQVVIRDYHGG